MALTLQQLFDMMARYQYTNPDAALLKPDPYTGELPLMRQTARDLEKLIDHIIALETEKSAVQSANARHRVENAEFQKALGHAQTEVRLLYERIAQLEGVLKDQVKACPTCARSRWLITRRCPRCQQILKALSEE